MSLESGNRLNECGCCAGITADTPVALFNRPGLSAVAYRVGTYATFRQSLLARLSDARWPILRGLRTRADDDFTIALLDAWAVTGDVLTLYQERIANEAYLRTATERLSIQEQARLLGYQLGPGLAASTHLAFTMEETPGAPEQTAKPIMLAVGTKVQSVPGQDEEPQSFETIEAIEARPAWNALLPQLSEPQSLVWNLTELWLEGTNLTLAVGDVLLIVAANGSGFDASIRRVSRVTARSDRGSTQVLLATISATAGTIAATQPGVYVLRTVASPFGHNAPLQATYANNAYSYGEWQLDSEVDNALTLSSRQDRILQNSWAVVERDDNFAPGNRLWAFAKVTGVTHQSVARYGMAGSATKLSFDKDVWVTEQANLSALRQITVASQSEELATARLPLTYPLFGDHLALDNRAEGLVPSRPIAVSGKRQPVRIRHPRPGPFRVTRAPIEGPQPPPTLLLDQGGSLILVPGDILRMTGVPSKKVGLSFVPLTPAEFGAALTESVPPLLRLSLMDRDGRTGMLDISAADIELAAVEQNDETISEIAFIDDAADTSITHDRDRTTLQLAAPLANVYERSTVRINANVAAATHGESVKEPLGSGDATRAYQYFTLRQPPLTYVSADTVSGSTSTLKVYVNDVLWEEAPFFYGRGPTEHIYVTQRDDEGRTTIRFGDGITGARLPTGQNNIRAEYRKGTGLGGLVQAGQLSLLVSRPLGLKDVVNPEAPQGAEDVEARDDARKNAPLTVLTLDRAVSLQDYEDFSRTFAGIAKALAVWVWDGRKRSIFITVAGPDGDALDEDGAVISMLKEALRAYGDPFVPFTVKSFRPAWFQIDGAVTVKTDQVIETVMAAVAADLQQRYSFDAREFGQPVALSEVIAAMQSIAGVVAVDLDTFARTDVPTPAMQPRLIADRPAMGADGAVPAAELLLLESTSLTQLKAVQ
ncbi:MAG: putative baseplate assembly protein [Nitrospira sp.]|nr:putative baseplate assembly protein [Nitrospira sp.]